MSYTRKTRNVYHIMANYGYGWESESEYDNYKDAKRDIAEYRASSGGRGASYYIKKTREKIECNHDWGVDTGTGRVCGNCGAKYQGGTKE